METAAFFFGAGLIDLDEVVFFAAPLADDFDAHGKSVVERVRTEDPSTYLRVFASMVPKELEITRPLDGVSDEELAALIELVRERIPPASDEPPTVN